jgi:hypothetical protein
VFDPSVEGVTDMLPEVASAPLQAPLAVQDTAFVDVQVSVEGCPSVRLLGLAERLTVGAAVTVTVAVLATVPPAPVQVSV